MNTCHKNCFKTHFLFSSTIKQVCVKLSRDSDNTFAIANNLICLSRFIHSIGCSSNNSASVSLQLAALWRLCADLKVS